VGWIEERENGMAFGYDANWAEKEQAPPISLTLPVRAAAYETRGIHPYFLGLLPEGWLFNLALSRLKISRDDAFGLVLALCRDCVGATRILPEDEPGDSR
jgi:serine/threonine-protein kinase HipA